MQRPLFEDHRGSFQELFRQADWQNGALKQHWIQDNLVHSQRNVLRGLHYQFPSPQAKLIQVIQGEVYDVAVDLRPQSATYGQHCGIWLNEHNRYQFYIPEGFAHGYWVASEQAIVHYKVSAPYAPEYEHTIIWNDPTLAIQWPFSATPILSPKDRAAPSWQAVK